MVYPWLGLNITNTQLLTPAYQKYFGKIGMNIVRPHQVRSPYPWAAGTPSLTDGITADLYAYWRQLAISYVNAGYYVTYGPSYPQNMGSSSNFVQGVGGSITATIWAQHKASVIAEAQYMQANGIAFGDFSLGNELEGYLDGTTITVAQMDADIRGPFSAAVKAVYTLSPISYSLSYGVGISNSDWLANGLGNLDYLSVHPYGQINSNQTVSPGTFALLPSFVAAFGYQIYVSEFNLDANGNNYANITPANQVAAMNTLVENYLIANHIPKAILYKFDEQTGNTPSDYGFAQIYPDGSMNPVWWDFFQSNPIPFITETSPIA